MKAIKFSALTLLTFSSLTLAETSALTNDKIPGVKKLTAKTDGTYIVKCANKSKGTISTEETNICVFSKENKKNRCDDESNWSVENAAEHICN